MKSGTTIRDCEAGFDSRNKFKVPSGTYVEFGAKDCDGQPFGAWTLPEKVARELSGNAHDSAYQFVTIPADNVKEG